MANRRSIRRRRPGRKRDTYNPRGAGSEAAARHRRALAAVLLGVIGLAAVVVFSPLFGVRNVSISGAKVIDATELSSFVKSASEQRYGPLVSPSLLVVREGELEQALRTKFDGIAKVEVRKKLPNTVEITLTERQSALVWESGGQAYLVDRQGIAYARTEPQPDLVNVVDSTGLPVEVGRPVVGGSFIAVLEQIRTALEQRGIKVSGFRIPESTFEVQAVTDQKYYVLFDATRNIENQVMALEEAIRTTKPTQYADLRVPGRVYVR